MKLIVQEVYYETLQIRTIKEIEISSIRRIIPTISDEYKEGIIIITKTEEGIRWITYYNHDDYYYNLVFKE